MLVNIPATLASYGLGVSGVAVLQQREDRLVAKVETNLGPVVIKAAAATDAFASEVSAIMRLAALGFPVARIIGHGSGHLVLAWTEGDPLSSTSPVRAQQSAGRLLRQLHTVGASPDFPDGLSWDEWMAGWLNSALAWWAEHAQGVDVAPAWAWYHRLRPLLATRGRDLILFDGRREHILVADGDVSGFIDVAEVRSGDGAMDLAVLALTDPELLPGLLDGYRADADERAIFAELVPFYTVLRRVSYAQWMRQHGTEAELTDALDRLAATGIP